MGQKYQDKDNRGYEITLTIRDENMRRIHDQKQTPLLKGIGQLLAFCVHKLNIELREMFRAEIDAELSDPDIYGKKKIVQELLAEKKGG